MIRDAWSPDPPKHRAPHQRAKHAGREEEERDRPAKAEHDQERRDVAEQEVLRHVRGEELVFRDGVERGDDG